ncbi:hypothetical protein K1719_001275 [Acacia pycnantha]|nr:hypothetical protein K1719_001275 [Acacia pycnantha]
MYCLKEGSNLEHNRPWHPHSPDRFKDDGCTISYIASSDSIFSDDDGLAKGSGIVKNSRVRVAAIISIQDLCQADFNSSYTQWHG